MKKVLAALLIASIISAGCAHTTANPVLLAQPGDDTKSCDGIANEMQQMVQARATAETDRNNQIAGNVALGVAGIFLIVPWFFMDTGNAATVEERAAQARYQRLNQMSIDRKCPATPLQAVAAGTPDAKPASATTTPAEVSATKPEATLVKTAAPQAVSPSSQPAKWSYAAEQVAKANGCVAPIATMNYASAGAEAFTVTCGKEEPVSIRCDFGNCKALK